MPWSHTLRSIPWSAPRLVLTNVGWAAMQREDYSRAQEALEEALALQRDLRTLGVPNILRYLGFVALEQGNLDRALEHFEESLSLASGMRWVAVVIGDLDGIGQVIALQGQLEEAATVFGSTEALARAHGIPVSRTAREQGRVELARAALGEADWERAFSKGQDLSMEAAVALAQGSVTEGGTQGQEMTPQA